MLFPYLWILLLDKFNYIYLTLFYPVIAFTTLDLGLIDRVLSEAEKRGASYVDVRLQEYRFEALSADNRVLKSYTSSIRRGLGVRVLVDGYQGYASTSNLSWSSISQAIDRAIALAKASREKSAKIELAETPSVKEKLVSPYKVDPFTVDPSEKARLVLELNKEAFSYEGVKSAITNMGFLLDRRIYASSNGSLIDVTVRLTGLVHMSVAGENGRMERIMDTRSRVAGYEFIEETDWRDMIGTVSKLAYEASKAQTPRAGPYTVVLAPDIVGLLLHEAFGHASEGDGVDAGASVLAGRLGEKVASEHVTIIDEGVVEGGYYHPYDDEGVRKEKTIIVENGVLKNYLTSRHIAVRLGLKPTGNGRAEDYRYLPLVRQTNYYLAPRDYKLEEILEDVREGIYITAKGAAGGEVNPGTGTFTFGTGASWMIRNGELGEMVRGVSLSGMILEVLKEVDAVGRDLEIRTSVFGGCGKNGQMVKVGFGGPHVRVKKIIVGGR